MSLMKSNLTMKMISCKITRLSLITIAFLLLYSIGVSAQEKQDTTIEKKHIQTVQRNMLIIQQTIHTLHIDGVLRDKLDSVYNYNMFLLSPSVPLKPKQNGKKP